MSERRSWHTITQKSTCKRPTGTTANILLGVQFLIVWLLAGIAFGWASLVLVLKREGVYHESCDAGLPLEEGCESQERRLNLIFTLTSSSTAVANLVVGLLLDRYGTRLAGVGGVVTVAVGCVAFAFADSTGFDVFIPAMMLIAYGGMAVLFSSFHFSHLYPRWRGTVLSILNGLFDSSAAVFVLFELLNRSAGMSRQTLFLFWAALAGVLGAVNYVIQPKRPFLLTLAAVAGDDEDDGGGDGDGDDDAKSTSSAESSTSGGGKMAVSPSNGGGGGDDANGKSASKFAVYLSLVRTKKFVFLVVYMGINQLRQFFYIGTLHLQLEEHFDDEADVNRGLLTFGLCLMIGGVLSTPLIGILMDRRGLTTAFTITTLFAIGTSFFNLFAHSFAAITVSFIIFSFYRGFFYSAVTTYIAVLFPFRFFGSVLGTNMVIAGGISLAQYGILYIVQEWQDSRFFTMNLVLLLMCVAMLYFPAFIYHTLQDVKSSVEDVAPSRAADAERLAQHAPTATMGAEDRELVAVKRT